MRDAKQITRARFMRQTMTEPEIRLWLQLRAERFEGVKFRRQKVIGSYIADFVANEPKLVIELDGDSHAHQQGYDDARTRFLAEQGYVVLRFCNSDVMGNMDGVLQEISGVIARLRALPPLPTLSPVGERAKGGLAQ